jgi:hypothetical protein
MKLNHLKTFGLFVVACCALLLSACGDDEVGKGDVEFEITDAPIDDASVDAVMVTIADVKVNGTSVSGFSKQTINLKAYQDGNTKLLVKALQLDARTYSNLTLVLDLDHDVAGNTPGCYVRTVDNTKYKLRTTTTGILDLAITKSWSVAANATSKVVLDFDLRKSITYSSSTEQRYRFVSDANLTNSIRVVAKSTAANIAGTYQESVNSGADEVVVYAYKKGSFNLNTETQAQGEDQVLFANAVSSTMVKSSLSGNSFTLALLEAGEYELYFAKYEDDGSGELEFKALLKSQMTVNGTASSSVMLSANFTANVSTNITGLL